MASPLIEFISQPGATDVVGSALRFIRETITGSPIVDSVTGSSTPDYNLGSSTPDYNLGSSTGNHNFGSTYP
ncbi:hypothetical protein ACWEVD_25420 [Nocardia thailandica]|uniref:Uncharacterized protein n=1 Tax=Nocardia thailandica TaxID=257275 RepID=A0ABW6PJ16_9NOCA|nr:hypothetical protein [Nocardia thailandica]